MERGCFHEQAVYIHIQARIFVSFLHLFHLGRLGSHLSSTSGIYFLLTSIAPHSQPAANTGPSPQVPKPLGLAPGLTATQAGLPLWDGRYDGGDRVFSSAWQKKRATVPVSLISHPPNIMGVGQPLGSGFFITCCQDSGRIGKFWLLCGWRKICQEKKGLNCVSSTMLFYCALS